jgi:hypothetical protein
MICALIIQYEPVVSVRADKDVPVRTPNQQSELVLVIPVSTTYAQPLRIRLWARRISIVMNGPFVE